MPIGYTGGLQCLQCLACFCSVPNGRVSQQRSAPIPMQTRTPGLDQSPRNIDQLFNINTGQQHPVSQSASLSPPPKPQSVTQTTGRASVGASQHEGDESTRLLHLNGLSARHAQSDQPSSSGSSSGSHAPAASALPRSVKLTEAVRDFLAKPVTGPCRPIFFDLETTGIELLFAPQKRLMLANCSLTAAPQITITSA